MGKRVVQYVFWGALSLAAVYVYAAWEKDEARKLQGQAREVAREVAGDQVHPEDVASLVLKDFDIKQGEGGVQLWRLRADWGGAQREGGLFQVHRPRFTYFIPPDNEPLHVAAQEGDINQATRIIRFFHGVEVRFGSDILKAEIMVYNGTSKTMSFPNGFFFAKQGMEGWAPYAEWLLHDKIINASGGVGMTWGIDRPENLHPIP